jgi:hypothetical protein
MDKKTINLLVISTSVTAIILIVVLGSLSLWTFSYLTQHYFTQYLKYDSIKVGMTKEQIQPIMKTTPGKMPTYKYTYSEDFDEVLVYAIPLTGSSEAVAEIVVFFRKDKIVGKEAYAGDSRIFDIEDSKEMKRILTRFPIFFAFFTFTGIAGAIVWIVIFPKYYLTQQKSNKKFWVDILLGICFVNTLIVVIILALVVFGSIVEILFVNLDKILIR